MSYDPSGGQGWQGGQPPQYPPPGGYGQQPPGWGAPPPAGYGGPPPSGTTNPFAALLDFSFTKFATPGLIKLIYIVGTVLLVLVWLGYTIALFQFGAGLGLLALIGGAIVVVFYLMFLRVSLEFFFAVVRMSEDIHKQTNR